MNSVGPPSAPRLVFVHGLGLDMTAWHYQWTRFRGGYRCVLYDHRGHGRSALSERRDYSPGALARDLRAVLDAEGCRPSLLVAHSLGGVAVVAFAERFPEEFGARVKGVVLANTTLGQALPGAAAQTRRSGLLPWSIRWLSRNPQRAYRLRSLAFVGGGQLASLVARLVHFGSHAPRAGVQHAVELASRLRAEVWTGVVTSLPRTDLARAPERVRAPALLLVGGRDRLASPSSARWLVGRLPDARTMVFPGAGHCLMLERPREFNRVLTDFAREVFLETGGQRA